MQCCYSAAFHINCPHHLCSCRSFRNRLCAQGGAGGTPWGQEPLPLKVAPTQPSVTAAFHLQSRRDSDCQMWELNPYEHTYVTFEPKCKLCSHENVFENVVCEMATVLFRKRWVTIKLFCDFDLMTILFSFQSFPLYWFNVCISDIKANPSTIYLTFMDIVSTFSSSVSILVNKSCTTFVWWACLAT